mgnify:CR=1 FL=1
MAIFGKLSISQLKTFQYIASHYQKRFGYSTDYTISAAPNPALKLIVVIPSFNEAPEGTLNSLGNNPIDPNRVEVILVLNYSENSEEEIKDLHIEQDKKFNGLQLKNGVVVHVIKAFDLPAKQAGVGLARKIGMDVALQRFSYINRDGLIVCFDADSTVSNNYLAELIKAESAKASGLSIAFEHPIESIENKAIKERICKYENWLRYYIQALRFTAYPHAYHTIGSSMVSRASAYAKIGGMNRKKAGEDFYFLHKLIPQGDFYDLTTCTVFPSARTSDRVPFGTGRAMMEMEAGEKDFSEVYNPEIFKIIKVWLASFDQIRNMEVELWPDFVGEAFKSFGWVNQVNQMRQRSSSDASFHRNFYFWFDGFKMLKLVHFGRDNFFQNIKACKASGELFDTKSTDAMELLTELREMDRESPFTYF